MTESVVNMVDMDSYLIVGPSTIHSVDTALRHWCHLGPEFSDQGSRALQRAQADLE